MVAGAGLPPSRSSRARTAAAACMPCLACATLLCIHAMLYLACRTRRAVLCSYAVADNVNAALIGRRCLVRSCQRGPKGFSAHESKWMGSDFNGAFAQFVKVIWTGWRGRHSLIAVHHAATAGLMHAAHGFATARG